MSTVPDDLVTAIVLEANRTDGPGEIAPSESALLRVIRTCVEQWAGMQATCVAWDFAVSKCAARDEGINKALGDELSLAELSIFSSSPGETHILVFRSLVIAFVDEVRMLVGTDLANRIIWRCLPV
jgi:hypothetical protein